MKKKIFSFVLVALLGMIFGLVGPLNNTTKAEEIETVDVYGTHNYFTGNGGVWGTNQLLKDQKDNETDKITYTRLTTTGGDNCFLFMDSEERHAGNYVFTAMVRAHADFVDQNIGFGFWANAPIGNRIKDTVISPQLKANEWRRVTVKFEFNETEANAIDSIHLWCLQPNAYVDFYGMSLLNLYEGVLGENLIKDVGFENVDLSGGDRKGWNDRHSGVISGNSNITWTKEVVDGQTNQYLALKYEAEGDAMFVDWCSFLNDWNGSWPAGIPAGEYFVEFDVRTNALFDTNNVGFALYSRNEARIERDLTPMVKAAPVGEWTHITYRYPDFGVELTQNYADGVDTIQFWANSMNIVGWELDIDNVSIRKISLVVDERPEFVDGVYGFEWIEENNKDVEIVVSDLHGKTDLELFAGDYKLVLNEDYTFDAETNKLVIKKAFVSDFDDGVAEFVVKTSGGERQFTIEVTHKQEPLPDLALYDLEETVFGGDFKDVDVGYRMKEEQTQYAWGAVSAYDDGGLVIEEADGTRALSFKKPEGSGKTYSSSFVIYHPEKIVSNTIVTFAFDYKYLGGSEADGAVDVCWVGSSNTSYHLIKLNGTKNAKTIEPQAKYRTWDVAYTELANGYTHVEVSLRVDNATVTATNSIRFLMKYNGNAEQELRIQNVSLKKWVKALGKLDITEATFDKANQQNIVVNATFDEGLSFYGLAIDSKTTYVENSKFAVEGGKITISKDYLATLANGEHTFYVSSTENASGEYAELELKVTVSGEVAPVTPDDPTPVDPEPAKKSNTGLIIGIVAGVVVVCGCAAFFILRKKRK